MVNEARRIKIISEEYNSTWESDCLKCPYCGNENSDAWEIDFDDDKIEIDCDCGKKFYGLKHVSINYEGEADCELNGGEHKLESTGNEGQYKCNICGKYVHKIEEME